MVNRLERIKEIIQESLDTHLLWREYYKKHPEEEDGYKSTVGDSKHQEYCIEKYEEALRLLDELKCPIS